MTKIVFNDGSVLNAEQNGTNYIVNSKPAFPEDLTNITIEGALGTSTIENGMIVECFALDNRYWFTIVEKPQSEVLKEQILDLECIISDLLKMM